MQESVSMLKSPTQLSYESSKVRRSVKKRGKTESRRLIERKAAQHKHIGGTRTRPTKAQLGLTKALRTLSRHYMMRQDIPLPSTLCDKKIVSVEWIPRTLTQRDATRTYMIKIIHRQISYLEN